MSGKTALAVFSTAISFSDRLLQPANTPVIEEVAVFVEGFLIKPEYNASWFGFRTMDIAKPLTPEAFVSGYITPRCGPH